jgi:hypothetical protein
MDGAPEPDGERRRPCLMIVWFPIAGAEDDGR